MSAVQQEKIPLTASAALKKGVGRYWKLWGFVLKTLGISKGSEKNLPEKWKLVS